ncbi:hypothetical protein [Rhodoferax sp. WC2427]|uniref:hypothetical protein n=1 Tax=Rhodoferax sp. WC2427 TaxID=3234144 RepID=UPI0034657867
MRVVLWRLAMFVLLGVEFVWLLPEVLVDRIGGLLRRAADAAEINWILAGVNAALAAKLKAKGMTRAQFDESMGDW